MCEVTNTSHFVSKKRSQKRPTKGQLQYLEIKEFPMSHNISKDAQQCAAGSCKFIETFNVDAMSYLRCCLALALCGMISKRRRPKRAVWQGNGEKLSSDNLRAFSTYQKHTRVRPGLQAQDMDSDMETHMHW